jgi:hypothetical protein
MSPMKSKTQGPRKLSDEEMLQRLGRAQDEDRHGELIHCETENDVRAFFSSARSE